jgi:four helix bundle protein
MGQLYEEDFNAGFRERTKELAFQCIFLYKEIRKTDELRIIGRQLIRSATSVAANFRAACRARSRAEYFSKICIVVEECDETLFWLELMQRLEPSSEKKIWKIMEETNQLLIVFSKTKKTLRNK